MDDYADIYYVDTRNAVRDHRPGGSAGSGGYRPGGAPPPRPPVVYTPPMAQPIPQAPPPMYAQPTPGYVLPQQGYLMPQQGYLLPQQASPLGNLFGKLTTGQVIEMVAQLFAALQPLPAAPVPTRSGDTDSGNNILFQDALAKHAKRDEQIRTVGTLVSRLVG